MRQKTPAIRAELPWGLGPSHGHKDKLSAAYFLAGAAWDGARMFSSCCLS